MKYCPKCGSEFENWVVACSDCGVELSFGKPEPMPEIPKELTEQLTDGYYNGRYILDCIKRGNADRHYYEAFCYVEGLLDALYHEGQSEQLNTLYGEEATNDDVFTAVCNYYRENPSLQHKPVIEVLLKK